ncbi:non-ribosomal peptide synthetase, partial [Vibrio mangrovi]
MNTNVHGNNKQSCIFHTQDNTSPPLPLSTPQKGIWFAQHIVPDVGGRVFRVAGYLDLPGEIIPEMMEFAVRQGVGEAETFHITTSYHEDKLLQTVHLFSDWELPFIDLSQKDNASASAMTWMEERLDYPVAKGEKDPLFEFALLKVHSGQYYLYCSAHHITTDGYGFMMLVMRFAEIYSALYSGHEIPACQLLGIKALLEAEDSYRGSTGFERDRSYWLDYMDQIQNYQPISLAGQSSVCSQVLSERYILPLDIYEHLQQLVEHYKTNLATLITALTSVYLHLMTGESSMMLGFTHRGRMGRTLRQTTGMAVNILPLGLHLTPEMTFPELLEQVSLHVGKTSRHSRYYSEDLRQEWKQSADKECWFNTVLNFVPSQYELYFGDVSATVVNTAIGPVDDLSFTFYDRGEGQGLTLYLNANADLYDRHDIQCHLQRLESFLSFCASSDITYPARLSVLSPEEQHLVLELFNQTLMPFSESGCLHHLFESQVVRTPDAIAVVSGEEAFSYRQLNDRANQLAHRLTEQGVKPGSKVAVMVERSCTMVTALLATLKAGGAYVPLDPLFPPERLQYMVSDSQPVVLITDGSAEITQTFGEQNASFSLLDLSRETLNDYPTDNLVITELENNQLAYVIYTSGSTGQPKGVMVPHRSVVNFLTSQQQQHNVSGDDRLLAITTISFDIHVLEIYLPLISGAALHLADKMLARDGEALGHYLNEQNITLFQATPATWKLLLAADWQGSANLRGLIGGESFSKVLADEVLSRVGSLWNMYGPTETTVWSATHQLSVSDSAVLIGRPVGNTRIYILNEAGQPVPVGATGEIYIGGEGVTAGYLNQSELTQERFVADPYSSAAGARMYRTGDLGRWDAEGRIECLGRSDFQVKIRGFRIELGEIESLMQGFDGIADAVVAAPVMADGEPRLVGYYVADEAGDAVSEEVLKTYLRSRLPDYMVPGIYVVLEDFPLTPNGKVDRKALPEVDGASLSQRIYEAPQGETEAKLAEIWAEMFGIAQVSRHDDFFELGGHSLMAMQLISRVRQQFQVDLALATVFAQPVLYVLSAAIENSLQIEVESVVERLDDGIQPPLSLTQRRLWLLSQIDDVATQAYIMVGRMTLQGKLDVVALQRALDQMLSRHHILRTCIEIENGEPVQKVFPEGLSMSLPVVNADDEQAIATFGSAMDLSTGPLLQGQLISVDEQTHILRLAMHHMITDGWSIGIFMREVSQLYAAFVRNEPNPFPPLEIQYGDFAAWQQKYIQDELLQQQRLYWVEQLRGIPDCLTLPTDRARPHKQEFAGAEITHVLDESLTAELHKLSRQHDCTLYMTLLASWSALMGRLAHQDDVVIGTPVAGRTRAEFEPLIGMFVNTQAMRVDLSANPDTAELLAQVKATALLAQAHQEIPFEQVVESVSPVRRLSHTPVFQVMFALQNVPDGNFELPGLSISPLEAEVTTAQFDLSLFVYELDHQLEIKLNYATALFDETTVRRYLAYWQALLQQMVSTPEQTVSSFDILSKDERELVIETFNATETVFPQDECLHHLFESQVVRTPDAIAVVSGEEAFSYRQLNDRANQLAHRLTEQGVKPGSKVAVMVERSCTLVTALLATLKAGGAYVPLDPLFPPERLQYMVSDSQPVVLITDGSAEITQTFGEQAAGFSLLDLSRETLSDYPTDNPVITELENHQLAYVIYTSGSTGQPKGVMVPHRSVVNFLTSQQQQHNVSGDDRLLAITTISFDIHVLEIYLPLISGASLHLADKMLARDGEALGHYLNEQNITLFQATPATWKLLLAADWQGSADLRGLIGGESFSKVLADEVLSRVGSLWNMYGPTETTVWSATHQLSVSDSAVLIGRPVGNTRIYILNDAGRPVPVGATGEIYIGGEGVTAGYLNQSELTQERFVADPYSSAAGARMYRTGDLGRWDAEGRIECLGRSDFQVKIRGFRIELGEIESLMQGFDGIADAVVAAPVMADGEPRLVGYYVADEAGDALSEEMLKTYLRSRLPDYMVPGIYVVLEDFPLTPNGKVDRKALPEVDGASLSQRVYEAPQGETETKLSEIWAEMFGIAQVSRHDDFFELGGHSLMAVQLVSRIRALLGLEMSLASLFEHPVLAELAAILQEDALQSKDNQLPAIVPHTTGGAVPLSLAQQRLWFLSQMNPAASSAYVISGGAVLRGRLDVEALQAALDQIVARHEALRTHFEECDGVATQVIEPSDIGFPLTLETQSHIAFVPEFRLDSGRLIQGQLIRVSDEEHRLSIAMHHIISDGWSVSVLISELAALYDAFIQGLADPLPALDIQYGDFAVWQQQYLQGDILQRQQTYWVEQLQGIPDCLTLPTDRPRPQHQSYEGAVIPVNIDRELSDGLRNLSQRHGCTLYMTLLAGWSALMGRLSSQDDVVIGSPVAGRTRAEVEPLIGMFVNTQAMRVDLSANPSTTDLLTQVKATALAAQAHQDLPFEQVVESVAPQRSLSHPPIFQVMLSLQNTPQIEKELSGVSLSLSDTKRETAQFDLSLEIMEVDGQLSGYLNYVTALFDEATVQRYLEYWKRLLQQMVCTPQLAVNRLDIWGDDEYQQVVHRFNQTEIPFPERECIHALIEGQVARNPDATAVVFEDQSLSYAELNRQANRLAHWLMSQGVRPDSRVAVCLERSCELVVSLLAILKAGGAYVPLDPGYPTERLEYMLSDSEPVVLITTGTLLESLGQTPAATRLVDLSSLVQPWTDCPDTNPNIPELTNRHLAYIIYTSGSTGLPKGVMNEHRGVVNRLYWMKEDYGFGPGDVVLQKTPFSFDVSVWEFFCPLWSGATLLMAKPEGHKDPDYLKDLITSQGVTILHFVPPMLQSFLEVVHAGDCNSLRLVFCSGEALPAEAIRKSYARLPHIELHNLYGPTEAAVDVTAWHCPRTLAGDRVSIGRPVANTRMYVLDGEGRPVAVGVEGELYIGGVQVARGYLNRDELTAERFVADPYSQETDAVMYRTGDVGCWLSDGTIEYRGRNDDQVKIRGFRIELGEISSALQGCVGVKDGVVVARAFGSGSDKQLVGYYTAEDQAVSPDVESIKAELTERLPAHMVPVAYVLLDEMPLTPNGKVNRKALPEPDERSVVRREYEAPVGDAETQLANIWSSLLGVERVGRYDNFFELGGHSLLAVRMISRVRELLGCELTLATLFSHPALYEVAGTLSESEHPVLPAITPLAAGETAPLSLAQKRLWFLAQMDPDSVSAYVITGGLRLEGKLDVDALQRALNQIVTRHAPLRTHFADVDGVPVQIVDEIHHEFPMHWLDGETLMDELSPFRPEFDLSHGPLVQGQLIHIHDNEHWLRIAMHHMVADGWSIGVFTRELSVLYREFSQGRNDPLPPLSIQYGDYAAWQQMHLQGEVLQQQQQYWTEQLRDIPDCLTLPTDRPRPAHQDYSGAAVTVRLDKSLTSALREFSQSHHSTLYMTLLTGWSALMGRLANQEEVVIGSPVAGRTLTELEGLIGMFVNTQAVRVSLSEQPDTVTLLNQVKNTSLQAQAYQDIPFEQVVEAVAPTRNLSYSPIFQVMFALQNLPEGNIGLDGMHLSLLPEESTTAQFDLSLIVHESEGRIEGVLNYATSLFDEETVQRYLSYWINLLEGMVSQPELPIAALPILGETEQQKLLGELNQTHFGYPADCGIHTLFARQVARSPEQVAVVTDDGEWDYTSLDVRANALAHRLREQGVAPGDRVAVRLPRSAALVVTELAILKCGGVYVPLDPNAPAERQQYVVDDCGATVLIAETGTATEYPSLTVLEMSESLLRETSDEEVSVPVRGTAPAYVMYTSGSTGQPKGVVVPHRAIARLVLNNGYMEVQPSDR